MIINMKVIINETRLRTDLRCLLNEIANRDDEYMQAVQAGDIEKAGAMVREAFKAKYPNTKVVDKNGEPMMVYHGTKFYDGTDNFNKFEHGHEGTTNAGGFFYATVSTELAARYGGFDENLYSEWEDYRSDEKPETEEAFFNDVMANNVYRLYVNMEHPLELGNTHNFIGGNTGYCQQFCDICCMAGTTPEELAKKFKKISNISYLQIWEITSTATFAELIKSKGYDGTVSFEGQGNGAYTVAVLDSNQLKSAEPVTYNNQGEVIPLSQRFTNSDNIRYEEE